MRRGHAPGERSLRGNARPAARAPRRPQVRGRRDLRLICVILSIAAARGMTAAGWKPVRRFAAVIVAEHACGVPRRG